jgi:polysaccharide deacetylase family protein (PEP-CTERM system associated)
MVLMPPLQEHSQRTPSQAKLAHNGPAGLVLISFDIEPHDCIEASLNIKIDFSLREHYRGRVAPVTRRLLEQLAGMGVKASFFLLGKYARSEPGLVLEIQNAGHEVASHGWDHRRVLAMTPEEFRVDLRQSKDVLEQLTGTPVLGYRAPTFSIVPRTAWALDILAEEGFLYDSSIFPVRHDRYGIPKAPRAPFLARGHQQTILEFPPATLRLLGANLPAGGGGYFRLFPPAVLRKAIAQAHQTLQPGVAMLYFHPWEFDPEQPTLPLRPLSRFRTYVGINRTRSRLMDLLQRYQFARADVVAQRLLKEPQLLPSFMVADSSTPQDIAATGTSPPVLP